MFLELINIEKAEKLLCNWDTLQVKWDLENCTKKIKKTKKNQMMYLKKIIEKAKLNGITTYNFSPKKDYGRMYADSPSLQGLKRIIRNTICEEYYTDIDMVRCQSKIALWWAKKNGMPFNFIEDYTDSTKELYSELKEHKSLINKIGFGSLLQDTGNDIINEWTLNYQNQMKIIGTCILGMETTDPDIKQIINSAKKAKDNRWGKCLANVLQKYENDILEQVLTFLAEKVPLKNFVKIFDGFLLPKEYFTEQLLDDINEEVFKTLGIPVQFIQKSFDETIDTSTFEMNRDKKTLLEILDEFMPSNINFVKNINGIPWIFDLSTGMWNKNDFGGFMKLCANFFGRSNIYGGDHRHMKNLFVMLITLPDSTDFYIKGIDLRKGKILYSNGIKNIETDTFEPEFNFNYFFTKRIPRDYNRVKDLVLIEKIKKTLFEDPHDPEIANELIKALGLAMTGKNVTESQYENLGSGSNGKSMMMESLLDAFPGYIEPFNITTIRVSPFAKANEHSDCLVMTADIRIGFSSEGCAGMLVDSEVFKRLCTQEPFYARECGQKCVKIKPEMTLFTFGQNPLAFDKIDTAVQRRRRGFPWNKTFKKAPDGTLDFLKTLECYQSLDHILQTGYNDWKTNRFIEIESLQLFKEDIDGEQDTFGEMFESKFNNKKSDKENKDNWILSTEIYRDLKELKMSDWAIKKKMLDLGIDCKRSRKKCNECNKLKKPLIDCKICDINPKSYFQGITKIIINHFE